ncbi:MAG: hypothetical protein AAFZ52_07500 [Bacteroidota bacterium]
MAEQRDPFDGDYIGNIFGWKISMIGLVVIVFFTALIAYRHWSMDVPIGFADPLETEEVKERYAPAGTADRDTTLNRD